jgi:hypothetical protein
MATNGGDGGGGGVRALAICCVVRRWESCACSGAVEAGEVEQRARQMIRGRRGGVHARGPLWAGCRSRPKVNNDIL